MALVTDPLTDTLYAYSRAQKAFHALDRTTGVATLAGSLSTSLDLLTFAADNCLPQAYGAGCPGTGGFIPALSVLNCPAAGGPISVLLDQALGGSSALLLIGLGQGQIAVGQGCSVLVSPILPAILTLPLGGGGAGNGTVLLNGVIPPAAAGLTFTLQTAVIDGGTILGAAFSNGVQIDVP